MYPSKHQLHVYNSNFTSTFISLETICLAVDSNLLLIFKLQICSGINRTSSVVITFVAFPLIPQLLYNMMESGQLTSDCNLLIEMLVICTVIPVVILCSVPIKCLLCNLKTSRILHCILFQFKLCNFNYNCPL